MLPMESYCARKRAFESLLWLLLSVIRDKKVIYDYMLPKLDKCSI